MVRTPGRSCPETPGSGKFRPRPLADCGAPTPVSVTVHGALLEIWATWKHRRVRGTGSVARWYGEGHSSVHSPTGSDFVVRRRDRTGGPRQVREPPAHSEDPGGGELGSDRTGL